MIQMMVLSHEDYYITQHKSYKAAVITIVHEVGKNDLEMNGKIEILREEMKPIKKNQMEML